jgi:hypothetical protein
MASGVVVQFAVFSVSVAILIYTLIMYKRRKTRREPLREKPPMRPVIEKPQAPAPQPMHAAVQEVPIEAPRQAPGTISMEMPRIDVPPMTSVNAPSMSAVPKPVAVIDVQAALTSQEDRNERILAGISENIRKSLQTRPVPKHSTIPYGDTKPRNTEYVRVKKDIIIPHGHIRFSILKDWMSINMLAVFRRASLDWKSPDDLIAFLPSYLEPEAEVLNNQVLIIGTPGHNEKLAVPIRSLDASSHLSDCFDFVSDVQSSTNTPAVLIAGEMGFEIVSRGVITQPVFANAVEHNRTEVKLLVDRSPEALQKSYSAALRRMEPTIADAHS